MSRPKTPSIDRLKSSEQFIGKGPVIDLPPSDTRVTYEPCGWVTRRVVSKVYDFSVWHALLSARWTLE